MSVEAPAAEQKSGALLEAIAVIGSAIVFLLALASLAHALLAGAAIPDAFRKGAVIAHFATVLTALPLAVSQILLPKGTLRHRFVGYAWCALMTFTALVTFAVHQINPGGLSPIHVLSALVLVLVPLLIFNARTHRIGQHRRMALGLVIGALVIAGLFTFLPGRALGELIWSLWPH